MVKVSIVIVCMNNLKNLYPCLDSIRKYTNVSYETLVVAYLFSKENLDKLRRDYHWVTIIESNEIRGFSENNNLALKQAKGEYCFVLNDDTEMEMPVIDKLVENFLYCPSNTAIISPTFLNFRGETSACGRPPIGIKEYLLEIFHLWNEDSDKIYVNKSGLFKTYNILGAAFLIRRDIFCAEGWFDERYFFCPEDIALSTQLNRKGYSCYVDSSIKIIHYEGMSSKSTSLVQTATRPAACKGEIVFYSDGNIIKEIFLRIILFITYFFRCIYHFIIGLCKPNPNVYQILAIGDKNCLYACLTNKTPKDIFKNFFSKIKKKQ